MPSRLQKYISTTELLFYLVKYLAKMTSSDGKSMRSLCCDLDHYARCITEFESRLAWLPDFEKWVRDYLGEKVLDQIKLPRLQEGSPLRMLGVGIGRGKSFSIFHSNHNSWTPTSQAQEMTRT